MIQLSIIIPHYNSTELLENLLETIPDNENIQVIIIDDNSCEDDKKKLDNLILKKNMELYINDSGVKGAGACRNIGIKKAIGKWLLFADADDYFKNNFYSIVNKYFDSKVDVVYFVPTSVNLKDGTLAKRHITYKNRIQDYLKNPNLETENNIKYRFSPPWSKLIKRRLVSQNKIFFDEVIASNDIMFSTKVGYKLTKFEASHHEIYCVTRSEGTLTRTMTKPIFESRLKVFITYNDYLRKRISKEEYKTLNIVGAKYLKMALNFGLLKTITVYIKLKKHNIKIVDSKLLSPVKLLSILSGLIMKKIKGKRLY